MELLEKFIFVQRSRFIEEQNNMFAFSWGKVQRRLKFLEVIMLRHSQTSIKFVNTSEKFQESVFSGLGTFTDEQKRFSKEIETLSSEINLDIESAYLFAKIILDDIARAIEYYFGKGRGVSLDSHDDLEKNLNRYCEQKQILLQTDLLKVILKLKEDVSDYRDYKICHEKSPRTVFCTMWDENGRVTVSQSKIHPKDSDLSVTEFETPKQLYNLIEKYLENIILFIEDNQSVTNLQKS